MPSWWRARAPLPIPSKRDRTVRPESGVMMSVGRDAGVPVSFLSLCSISYIFIYLLLAYILVVFDIYLELYVLATLFLLAFILCVACGMLQLSTVKYIYFDSFPCNRFGDQRC